MLVCMHVSMCVCMHLCVYMCCVDLHARTSACPYTEVGVLVETSLHYGVVKGLPLYYAAIPPVQTALHQEHRPLLIPPWILICLDTLLWVTYFAYILFISLLIKK